MKHLVKKTVIMALFAIALTNFIACGDKDDEPKEVSVTGVSLDKANLEKKVGETFMLKATVQPEDATNKEVMWKSSDETVAKVDANGEVTALKQGKATITVTTKDGNKTAVCTVKVTPKVPLKGIEVKEKYYIGVEEEKTLKITKTPENTTEQLQWKIADESKATIDSTGKITTKEIGETTITVKTEDGRITKTFKILVQPTITLTCSRTEMFSSEMNTDYPENVWVDTNGNGERDSDEHPNFVQDAQIFKVKSNTPTVIYGRLIGFKAMSERLVSLDVSKNKGLEILSCDDGKLKSLDISKNTNLRRLHCSNNRLTKLDVSKHTKLEYLRCSGNELTSLDVSSNTKLEYLRCSGNELTSLDVSSNTKLKSLECKDNLLTSLDVSMCPDLGVNVSSYHEFDCTKNELTCIKVSAAQKANIPSSWKKDYKASYNTTCD